MLESHNTKTLSPIHEKHCLTLTHFKDYLDYQKFPDQGFVPNKIVVLLKVSTAAVTLHRQTNDSTPLRQGN